MYDHQLAGKRERIAYRGSPEEVEGWLAARLAEPPADSALAG